MYRKWAVVAAAAVCVLLVACDNNKPTDGSIGDQAQQASQARADAFAKASALYPAPLMKNFPLRQALVNLTLAQDEVNHPWYIYIQAPQTGQVIAYYVGKTAPQNECNTLSDTEAITPDPNSYNDGRGSLILTAPTLNGVYAGGAGATGSCSTFFFQDASTGAFIELFGNSFIVMDQPLSLDVPRLRVDTGAGVQP
jgi:hypothetical protein